MTEITDTVRERIVEALLKLLAEAQDRDGKKLFNYCERGNLDEVRGAQLPAVALEEGDEEVFDLMFPYQMKRLNMFVEVRFSASRGVDAFKQFNYYLGELQRLLFTDHTMNGLTYNVQENGNNVEVESRSDPSPGGVLIIYVDYRHLQNDPYSQ